MPLVFECTNCKRLTVTWLQRACVREDVCVCFMGFLTGEEGCLFIWVLYIYLPLVVDGVNSNHAFVLYSCHCVALPYLSTLSVSIPSSVKAKLTNPFANKTSKHWFPKKACFPPHWLI